MSKINFDIDDFVSEEDIDTYLNNLYLEIGDVRKIKVSNELTKREWFDHEQVPNLVVDLCRNPLYLHFVAKYICNVDLLPYQGAALDILWNKLLVILIGSRGMAKSYMVALYCILRALLHQGSKIVVVGAGLRQSLVVWNYIVKIWDNAPVLQDIVGKNNYPKKDLHMAYWDIGDSQCIFLPLGTGDKIRGIRACVGPDTLIETNKGLIRIKESAKYMEDLAVNVGNGEMESPAYFVQTKPIDAYKITTTGGYNFICSDIHRVWTTNGWKLAKDLTQEDFLPWENSYVFPTDYQMVDEYTIDENFGFMLGILVSEGSVSSKHSLKVRMIDERCVDTFIDSLKKINPEFNVRKYSHEASIDPRGWNCKASYDADLCNLEFRETLIKCGLERKTALQKKIPSVILKSPHSVVIAFLRGLFWGDGSCFLWKSKARNNNIGVAYYSGSDHLINDLHILLSKFNIFACRSIKSTHLSPNLQHSLRIYSGQALDFANLLQIPKWNNVCEEAYKDWNKKTQHKELRVKSVVKLDGKHVLYDYTLPKNESFVGNGFRQHNTHILSEEFASIPPEIFETVVRGFAAVRSDGVVGNVVQAYKEKEMRKRGLEIETDLLTSSAVGSSTILPGNQIVLSGTAHFQFNHFYKYYTYYRDVILTGGNKAELKKLYPDKDISDNIDSSSYGIIRMPANVLPAGLMDENILNQGRATMDPSIFKMEYMACFPSDSEGFFTASMITKCTTPVKFNGQEIVFGPQIVGNPESKYFMGIDPASESDRFAINICELADNNRGYVRYQWSTNRKEFEKLKKDGILDNSINDYNTFCVKHILSLSRRFNIELICMDSGGGGLAIREGLKDLSKLQPGETPIIEHDSANNEHGRRILCTIQFSDSTWRKESHWGLRKDILEGNILFPYYDVAEVEVSNFTDQQNNVIYDTLDNVYVEIEDCKTETTYIKYEHTENGHERWGVASLKISNRVFHRDRFTSLLLSNWARRLFVSNTILTKGPYHESYGGVVRRSKPNTSMKGSLDKLNTNQIGNGRKIFY